MLLYAFCLTVLSFLLINWWYWVYALCDMLSSHFVEFCNLTTHRKILFTFTFINLVSHMSQSYEKKKKKHQAGVWVYTALHIY